MQLVAYGAQDIYLTGNPQITFFKVVYRRHTNFSMECIKQTLSGSLGASQTQTATISRNGDLVGRLICEISSFAGTNVDNVGAVALKEVEVEIGGQRIDRLYNHWLETWAELTEPNSSGAVATPASRGTGTKFQNMSGMGGFFADNTNNAGLKFVPLPFWFCRNPGLALPLIALQYHEVKVKITYTSEADAVPSGLDLWADYIYLDTDERRRFAQVSHEYLIEQVQHQNDTALNHDLNFNHPVKEIIWHGGLTESTGVIAAPASGDYYLKLNGHDRMAARPLEYYTRTQVWQHHTGPGGLDSSAGAEFGKLNDSIAVYSFALKPEEHQPSGTCNFSRIDSAQLIGPSSDALDIYAVNYNVLRIMSGMGGLAYSN